MKQADFQKEYHWLIGLREYFDAIGEGDRYEVLFKALYHDNWYRKRDVLTELYQKHDIETEKHLKSWMNLLLHEQLTDIEIKAQLVVTLIRKYMHEDPLLSNTARFINHWSGDEGEGAKVPDLNDFFSKGQVQSKLWLIRELKKVIEGSLGNVVFYGGWYNFPAHFIFQNFNVGKIYSLDLNEETVEPSKKLCYDETVENRFVPIATDVNRLRWNSNKLSYRNYELRDEQIERWIQKQESALTNKRQELIDKWIDENEENIKQGVVDKGSVIEKISEDLRTEMFKDKDELLENKFGWVELDNINCVINTSCEHMDNTWYENLPTGTFVVLHQNDYFSNEQHVNCCKDIEDVKSKYPMTEIYYEGELDTNLYNRFMLIGIK
tara:strand:+ start:705 stop:1844 length:1140 start_codon:yes stop_codon:yes gene_type:complete